MSPASLPPPPVPHRHDNVYLEVQELRRQAGQLLHVALREAYLVRDVLALDITEFAQSLAERAGRPPVERPSDCRQEPDAKYLFLFCEYGICCSRYDPNGLHKIPQHDCQKRDNVGF